MLALLPTSGLPGARAQDPPPPERAARIHSVTDLSHEFTFYFDGRFAKQYLAGESNVDVRHWATLYKADLGNANLLVLQSGATPCPYFEEDIAAVRRFLEEGGGVLILGRHALFRDETEYRLNALAQVFGGEFAPDRARPPFRLAPALGANALEAPAEGTIRLASPDAWQILIADADARPVLARRTVGKGTLVLADRALAGRRPDASDPIHADWWRPLLAEIAAGKGVDAGRPPVGARPENVETRDGLEIRSSDYLLGHAQAIREEFARVRPVLEEILGVPPSEGMLASLILLPTGGGGFSSGRTLGIGVFWGGFPERRYPMVELLAHESTHSWVLPFAEPMWNEGLATYVGMLAGRRLGHAEEADATLARWIADARKHDPDMTRIDLARAADVPHAVRMGKPMWIFEELRRDEPNLLARYFRAKRARVDPGTRRAYTADDAVALLSEAAGRDLFPWFRAHGIDVDPARTDLRRE